MWQYDWPAWSDLIDRFTSEWALERWFLMYLHEQQNIDALAFEIKTRLNATGRSTQVCVQSIWVDGTPQAEFSPEGHSLRTKRPQCELADLLLCVRIESPNGRLQSERAMLVQAKVGSKYNKLPGGSSTKRERQLYEDCDRDQVITLYPGVNRINPIGAYKLGCGSDKEAYGLRDCATFLLMAKRPWPTVAKSVQPLQIGWPLDKKKTAINPPEAYLEAIMGMVSGVTPSFGREVKTGASALKCVWTKMVNDLRGNYRSVKMNGYGGQARVTTSATSVISMLYSLTEGYDGRRRPAANSPKQQWLSLNLPRLLSTRYWRQLNDFRRLLDPKLEEGWESSLKFMLLLDVFDQQEHNLWNDNPNDPPPEESSLNDNGGPHLPILMVTIRGDQPDYHSD